MVVYDVPKVILMNTHMLPINVIEGRKRISLFFSEQTQFSGNRNPHDSL